MYEYVTGNNIDRFSCFTFDSITFDVKCDVSITHRLYMYTHIHMYIYVRGTLRWLLNIKVYIIPQPRNYSCWWSILPLKNKNPRVFFFFCVTDILSMNAGQTMLRIMWSREKCTILPFYNVTRRNNRTICRIYGPSTCVRGSYVYGVRKP
jgi:hypothetical protein